MYMYMFSEPYCIVDKCTYLPSELSLSLRRYLVEVFAKSVAISHLLQCLYISTMEGENNCVMEGLVIQTNISYGEALIN